MTEFPIDDVRGEFPALALTDDGRARAYLDNPAGTQVPRGVIEAVARCLGETNANLGGAFATSKAADAVVRGAHAAGLWGLGSCLEAPVFVASLDDVPMVGQAIEQRGGHLRITEDARPFSEGKVGDNDDRGAFVETADQVEQQLPAGLGEG